MENTKQHKPYPAFPLGWHASGYWYKRINGKMFYFGDRWGSAEKAYEDYLKRRETLAKRNQPAVKADVEGGLTVQLLCNYFLDSKKRQLDAGELDIRTFSSYKKNAKALVTFSDRSKKVEDMHPDDFGILRAKLMSGVATHTAQNRIRNARMIFLFAENDQLVTGRIRFGTQFKVVPKKLIRREKQQRTMEHGAKLFTKDQVHDLLNAANKNLKAMILLGVNAGLGNTDISDLHTGHIKGQWLVYPRVKTTVDREAWLWPETLEALEAVIGKRKGRVFTRGHGGPWITVTEISVNDGVAKDFLKLIQKVGHRRPGLSFYSLRHTFQTIGDGAKDPVAVSRVMGHVDSTMAGIYREEVDRVRIRAVCEHVRRWLYGAGKLPAKENLGKE